MSPSWIDHKITPEHLRRKAVVYLRQSSEWQVQHNKESQRLQYGLVDRAKALGWSDAEVIDTDLGSSASMGAKSREGLEKLLAMVALDEVGIIFSYELSRLSRTDLQWCRLLELCRVFDTLIADADQTYDMKLLNDEAMLGFKATLTVVESRTLKMRLQRGKDLKTLSPAATWLCSGPRRESRKRSLSPSAGRD
jgi:DNA invertase Pin-like site-specific DNA recombinase